MNLNQNLRNRLNIEKFDENLLYEIKTKSKEIAQSLKNDQNVNNQKNKTKSYVPCFSLIYFLKKHF